VTAAPRPDREAVVQVALPLPPPMTFSYSVPPFMPIPGPGCRVRVPFGRRRLLGMVVNDPEATPPQTLRPVEAALDERPLLPPEILEFTRWIARYYLLPWGMVLKCAYPGGLDPVPRVRIAPVPGAGPPEDPDLRPLLEILSKGPRSMATLKPRLGKDCDRLILKAIREGLVEQTERWSSIRRRTGSDRISLLRSREELSAVASSPDTPPHWRKILSILMGAEGKGFPSVRDLAREARVPQYRLAEMADAGLLELFEVIPSGLRGKPSPHRLNDDQRRAVEAVSEPLAAGDHEVFLLFGITGSGKTEVYLRLAAQAMEAGGTALYLVPEISMASFLARRLLERFGAKVAILHSSMTERERVRQWRRAAAGEARLVIGPRSALFAPLPDLPLIIVDEEHDGAYRQHESPRFHARDMAVIRGHHLSVPVILGSATPSVESYHNAAEAGKYRLLTLAHRAGGASLPEVEVVDMKRDFESFGRRRALSAPLREALEQTNRSGGQAVILRNRLGFDTFVLCRRCGRTLTCGECSVSLTHHRRARLLKCHYCGARLPLPERCPHCGGEMLQYLGEGTEKIEDRIARLLPEASVERMDRDRIRSGAGYDALWSDFEGGRIDVLVGTQMVAKGHDVHSVTLVGILSADFILGLPDFRGAERTFQLITQASGRAGRGAEGGRVILQTFHPDHYAVQAASRQDFLSFYEKDIRYRRIAGYPPLTALARVEIRHKDPRRADGLAGEAAALLESLRPGRGLRILGPVEAPIPRLEGRYRRQILLKAPSRNLLRSVLESFLADPFARKHMASALDAEIDPGSLL